MRRGGNTYNVCHKTGKIEYKDDKGGVARHYIRIGTVKDIMTPNGELNTVFDNDHILLEREIRGPAILSFRFFETERSTLSRYLMPRDHEAGKDLVGYFLEPKGPSTILRNQKQRIPAGLYHMTPNTGSAFPDVPRLYNDAIPRDRGILIHWGNDFRDTTACLLPSHNFKIKVVEEKEKIEDI